MRSPQTLSEPDRRLVAAWAADCAEHVLEIFEAAAPGDSRPRDLIARARAFHVVSSRSRRKSAAVSSAASLRARSTIWPHTQQLERPVKPQPSLIWAPMLSVPPDTPRKPPDSPRRTARTP